MRYGHKEAFCLLWYQCSCGARLRAWNSRDGAVPFSIGCASCGGLMRHVDWNLDIRHYAHKPLHGQLVFRDLTQADAELLADRRSEALGATPTKEERWELVRSFFGDGRQPFPYYHQEY